MKSDRDEKRKENGGREGVEAQDPMLFCLLSNFNKIFISMSIGKMNLMLL